MNFRSFKNGYWNWKNYSNEFRFIRKAQFSNFQASPVYKKKMMIMFEGINRARRGRKNGDKAVQRA